MENNIFKNLPIVFPFYEQRVQQTRERENNAQFCDFKLISPRNALLPFQLNFGKEKPAPTKWEILGHATLDITNNLNKITVYEFEEHKQAVYKGDALRFVHGVRDEELNLGCGWYYSKFTFADGSAFYSEFFYVPEDNFTAGENLTNYTLVEFWCDKDLDPVLYRDGFKQRVYLDTFVHSAVPEFDEEVEKDGYNSAIPTFQKLTLKYKFISVVPDYMKIALLTLLMQDNIYLYLSDKRSGKIDRVEVNPQPDETGAFNNVDVVFEDAILIKTNCAKNEQELNITTW